MVRMPLKNPRAGRSVKILLLASAISLPLLPPPAPSLEMVVLAAEAPGSLRGLVYLDPDVTGQPTGRGIGSVAVTLRGPRTDTRQTDSDGTFRFAELPPGRYTVSVVVPGGYEPTSGAAVWALVASGSVTSGIGFGVAPRGGASASASPLPAVVQPMLAATPATATPTPAPTVGAPTPGPTVGTPTPAPTVGAPTAAATAAPSTERGASAAIIPAQKPTDGSPVSATAEPVQTAGPRPAEPPPSRPATSGPSALAASDAPTVGPTNARPAAAASPSASRPPATPSATVAATPTAAASAPDAASTPAGAPSLRPAVAPPVTGLSPTPTVVPERPAAAPASGDEIVAGRGQHWAPTDGRSSVALSPSEGAPASETQRVAPRQRVSSVQGLRRAAATQLESWATSTALWLGVPFRTQIDGTQFAQVNCGPASLAMVMGAFGVDLDPAAIRDYVNYLSGDYSADNGTSLEVLAQMAREVGLDTYGVRARWSVEAVREHVRAGHPVITLVKYRSLPGHGSSLAEFDHYIVITGLSGDDLIYNDGAFSTDYGFNLLISPRDLERGWSFSSNPRHAVAIGMDNGIQPLQEIPEARPRSLTSANMVSSPNVGALAEATRESVGRAPVAAERVPVLAEAPEALEVLEDPIELLDEDGTPESTAVAEETRAPRALAEDASAPRLVAQDTPAPTSARGDPAAPTVTAAASLGAVFQEAGRLDRPRREPSGAPLGMVRGPAAEMLHERMLARVGAGSADAAGAGLDDDLESDLPLPKIVSDGVLETGAAVVPVPARETATSDRGGAARVAPALASPRAAELPPSRGQAPAAGGFLALVLVLVATLRRHLIGRPGAR